MSATSPFASASVGCHNLDVPRTVAGVDGDRRSDVRFSLFSLDGSTGWRLLFGARPLRPFSLGAPTPAVMAMTSR